MFDLFCTTDRTETFIVEMQLHTQHYFTDRVLFYSTYPIREQIVTPTEDARIQMLKDFGEEDWSRVVHRKTSYRLRPVYMVSILNFELPHAAEAELREGLVSSYSVRSDDGSCEQMTDALHFVFLELPRLRVDRDHPEACRTMLERIAFAFRHISFLQDRPESFAGEFFVHLFHAAELAGMNLDERNQYDIEMTTEIDKIAQLDYAHGQGVEEGRKEGREEGRKEGRDEGREEGRKEERWRIAHQMFHAGIDGDVIARLTTLSADEIRALG